MRDRREPQPRDMRSHRTRSRVIRLFGRLEKLHHSADALPLLVFGFLAHGFKVRRLWSLLNRQLTFLYPEGATHKPGQAGDA